jgi:hypothetical protein
MLAAGSQIITALAPALICASSERAIAISASARQRSASKTLASSCGVIPIPATAIAVIGSAINLVISENGPMAIPTGRRSVFPLI